MVTLHGLLVEDLFKRIAAFVDLDLLYKQYKHDHESIGVTACPEELLFISYKFVKRFLVKAFLLLTTFTYL